MKEPNEPLAPWNQTEQDPGNRIVEQALARYVGPYELYRAVYNATPCGPIVGFEIEWVETLPPDGFNDMPGERERREWFYGDDLQQWGMWGTLQDRGARVVGIKVGSIVEGIDEEVPDVEIDVDPYSEDENAADTLRAAFWNAVKTVNEEAVTRWNDTHGCPQCARLHGIKYDYANTPVHPTCEQCKGQGISV